MAPQPCVYGTFSNTDYYIYYSTGTNKIISTHPKTKTRQRISPSTPFPRPSFCLQR